MKFGKTNSEIARELPGKKIARVELRSFRDGVARANRFTADPLIIFDDGSALSFAVHETDVGEYGIDLLLTPGRKAP